MTYMKIFQLILSTSFLLFLSTTSQAQVLLIDFNDGLYSTGNWNNAAKGSTVNNLTDFDTGNATTISVSNTFSSAKTNTTGGIDWTGGPSWITSTGANDPERSLLFTTASTSAQIVFSGLDNGLTYNIQYIASRDSSAAQTADYTIGGVFATTTATTTAGYDNSDDFGAQVDGNNQEIYFYWNAISPTANSITIDIAPTAGGYGYVNAIRLEAVTVPEPSTWAMLGFGIVALFATIGARRQLGATP